MDYLPSFSHLFVPVNVLRINRFVITALFFVIILPVASVAASMCDPESEFPEAGFQVCSRSISPAAIEHTQIIDTKAAIEHFPTSDTLYLDEITIRSTRILKPLHYQPVDVQVMDSLDLERYGTGALSNLLATRSSLFIRDNGPGGLASLTQRGLSSNQTRVLWGGFPVNSLSLGQADISMIPMGLFNSVEVSPGTPSSAFGGGSLGGTVWLSSNHYGHENKLNLDQSTGAFDTWQSRIRAGYSNNRWSASVRGIYRTAENNFSFINQATGETEKRNHNAGRTGHLMVEGGYKLPNGLIHTNIWYSDRREEIPGIVLAISPEAVQNNNVFRWLTGLETSLHGWKLNLSSYFENDDYRYEDPSWDIDSRVRGFRGLAGLDVSRPSTGWVVWQGGISGGVERVETNNYTDDHHRRLLGLRLNPEVQISGGRVRLTPAIRMDGYTGFGEIVSPSLGVNWEAVGNHLYLRGLISRDFNPPSFNDLYWVPGGNPDLDPERSFKIEGGFVFLAGQRIPVLDQLHLTGYRIWLDDGIYWLPGNEEIWSPMNIEEVDARGMEARTEFHHDAGLLTFSWMIAADWRISRINNDRYPGDEQVGQQLHYVPEWSYRSLLDIRMHSLALNLTWRWTDRRYVTSDHSSSLEPFQVVNATIIATHRFRGVDGTLRITVRNLLDESYEVIQWYPMPGRHLEFTLGVGMPY